MSTTLTISGLHIYPVKSLGGIDVPSAQVTPRGLQHDRRYILINDKGEFMTQRAYPHMALLHPQPTTTGWTIRHALNPSWTCEIPFEWSAGPEIQAPIWKDTALALQADADTNEWFTDMLHTKCTLAYMPDHSHRQIDPGFSNPGEYVSFADGYPMLIVGESSLADLNARLESPVGMNRFRPNIVFTGDTPFAEDQYSDFSIGSVPFKAVKTCARCVLTTVDPEVGKKLSKEPLKTLSGFRNVDGRVIFGMNIIPRGDGEVAVGMELSLADN